MAITIVIGVPVVTVLLIGYPFNPMTQAEGVHLLQSVLYLILHVTPYVLIHMDNMSTQSKLQKLGQTSNALTGTAGFMALITFPEEGNAISQYLSERIYLLLLISIAFAVLLSKLPPFLAKQQSF